MARPRKVAAVDATAEDAQADQVTQAEQPISLADHIAAVRADADHATQCALDGLSMALTELQNRAANLAHAAPDLAERIATL